MHALWDSALFTCSQTPGNHSITRRNASVFSTPPSRGSCVRSCRRWRVNSPLTGSSDGDSKTHRKLCRSWRSAFDGFRVGFIVPMKWGLFRHINRHYCSYTSHSISLNRTKQTTKTIIIMQISNFDLNQWFWIFCLCTLFITCQMPTQTCSVRWKNPSLRSFSITPC